MSGVMINGSIGSGSASALTVETCLNGTTRSASLTGQGLPLSWKILGFLVLPDHFSKMLFHPIVTPSISISIFIPDRR
jgi:hypothetical protein